MLNTIPLNEKFVVIDTRNDKKYRASREDADHVFVYAEGRSRYGWRWLNADFAKYFTILPLSDKTAEWHKRIRRVLKAMDKTSLWVEKREMLTNLLTMTWNDHEDMNTLYWNTPYPHSYIADWDKWIKKYPFMVYHAKDGSLQIDTSYLWELSRVQLKSTYFGKYRNKYIKDEIRNALISHTKICKTARTSYDVSFEYDPDRNLAWYSEEYKNCGNGHYYLAVDENTAWFCEND